MTLVISAIVLMLPLAAPMVQAKSAKPWPIPTLTAATPAPVAGVGTYTIEVNAYSGSGAYTLSGYYPK